MRPDNQRTRSKRAGVARGRMYVKAKLNWLAGFPAGRGDGFVDWVSVPKTSEIAVEKIRLTREHLHDATYTYNKLVYNFPQALSSIVEDKGIWVERVPRLFDILKESIHKDCDFPLSLVEAKNGFPPKAVKRYKEVCTKSKALVPVVNAFSWVCFIYPDTFIEALNWVESHQKPVINILSNMPGDDGIIAVLLLFQIYKKDGTSKVAGLLGCLSNNGVFEVVVHGTESFVADHKKFINRLKEGKKAQKHPGMPKPDFAVKVIEFIKWLSGQDRATRRRALTLFSILLPEDFVEKRVEWWKGAFPVIEKSTQILCVKHPVSIQKSASDLLPEIKSIEDSCPPEFYTGQFFKLIKSISESANSDFYKKVLPVLKKLPAEENRLPVRAAFLKYFDRLKDRYSNSPALLAPFSAYLTVNANIEEVLKPWHETVFTGKNDWGVFENILSGIEEQRLWPIVFEVLPHIITYSEKFDYEDSDLIVSLVRVHESSAIATSYMKQFIDAGKEGEYCSEEQLRCIDLLVNPNQTVGRIVEDMDRLDLDDDEAFRRLIMVIEELKRAGWDEILSQVIEDGNLKVLNAMGLKYSALKKININTRPVAYPAESDPPEWGRNYPDELQTELGLLNHISVDAEKKASRIFSGHFPDREKLEREIETIAGKVSVETDNIKLAKRLNNLRKRLAEEPKTVSENQIARLKERLRRRIRTSVIQGWLETMSDQLVQEYEKFLNVNVPAGFFDDPANNEVMSGILNLPTSFRDVGLQLLGKTFRGDERYLYDHEENLKFIESIQKKGIKTEHWLNPPSPYQVDGKDGVSVTISFEEDPIEIIKMGQYFKTCLSPGSFNFFSAIVNAADINKHVVYARDKNGKVVGRCLFVLSKEGRVLTFNPYCHYNSLQFDKIMGALADELALSMNTVVASHGDVSGLVLNKWYDDGSTNLCHHFSFLHYDSDFRGSLSGIKTENFVPELEKLFSPSPLNESILPLIIQFEEFRNRPELILPLIPLINACEGLPDSLMIRAALFAFLAGERRFSVQILKKRAEKFLIRERQYLWDMDYTLLEVLVEINPSAALRVLRKTRATDVKSDIDETEKIRVQLLTMAHEQLGRRHFAGRLKDSD